MRSPCSSCRPNDWIFRLAVAVQGLARLAMTAHDTEQHAGIPLISERNVVRQRILCCATDLLANNRRWA
jgi:hypothetical protein